MVKLHGPWGRHSEGERVEHVSTLAHDEGVRLDPDVLGALYTDLGEAAAEGVICRAMEELANRLSSIERAYYQGEMEVLAKVTKGLVGIASQVGMMKLARCSNDVFECATGNDPVALASTVARLVRLGDRSLTAVWDTQDITI